MFDMKNNLKMIFFLLFLLHSSGYSQSLEFKGQASGWITANNVNNTQTQIGLRYIPAFSAVKTLGNGMMLNSEISINGFSSALGRSWNDIQYNEKLKFYRLWFRLSSSQMELRAGLQKINFGSASLIRPLMWFDRIDPRDPLKLTDGVYGMLFRYYFLNNANIWFWGLYGNDIKGWEIIPTYKNSIEYGGRFQHPLLTGEIALTYHHRLIDLRTGIQNQASLMNIPVSDEILELFGISNNPNIENRLSIDGKWDFEIGIWFEGALIHKNIQNEIDNIKKETAGSIDYLLSDFQQLEYQRLFNFGLDYTFGLGNGLYTLVEHFILKSSDNAFGPGESMDFSALSLNYPLGLLDNINSMIYYDWNNDAWYRFINFQRIYDNWSIYIIGFWNPDQFQIYQNQENQLFAGKGFQITVVFNH
jgi:hypothetical protein